MGPLPPPRELGTISHDNLNGSYNCERLSTSLTRQFLVRHPVRPVGLVAQAAALVFLIGFEIAFEPFDMAVALKRQDVRRQPVQEEAVVADHHRTRSEEHTSELQSIMRISYAVFCLKKKTEH